MATDKAKLKAVNEIIEMIERGPTQTYKALLHRGVDYYKKTDTAYRVLEASKIVAHYHTALLGNIVEVHGVSGYVAYAHVKSPLPVGTKLVQGGTIGLIAGPDDNYSTGTVTQGVHEHIALEKYKGEYAAGGVGKNPDAFVAKNLKLAKKRKVILEKRIAKASK